MNDYDTRANRAALEAEFNALPIQPSESAPEPASAVISVRLRPDELAHIERAATRTGLPLSAYIRLAALEAANPVDLRAISAKADALVGEAAALAALLRPGAA